MNKDKLHSFLVDCSLSEFNTIEVMFLDSLKQLVEDGRVTLAKDFLLTGRALEIRVKQLFSSIGFNIREGRNSLEDFIMYSDCEQHQGRPIVIEVKSGKSTSITRDHLRQLDDWVYELSGEEHARKHGLGGGVDPIAIATKGLLTRRHSHPNPHKGLFVYNGPIGTPFEQRAERWINSSEEEYARKRNFCVLPFGKLVSLIDDVLNGSYTKEQFWLDLHNSCGEFGSFE